MEEEITAILDSRYLECNFRGHKSPNELTNYCFHCFRHLDYKLVEGISEKDQRSLDRLEGLSSLRIELFPERLLLR